MASENQQVKSKRDTVRERIKTSRPDLNMDDEESVYGAIADDYDQYDEENKRLKEENEGYANDRQAMSDFLMSGEHNSEYFEGMLNGEDLFETAARIHGKQAMLDYLQSDEAEKKYKEAYADFEKKKEENSKLKAESEQNLSDTDAALAKAVEEGRFTEDEATKAINGLFDMADGLKVNVCKPEWIEMWLKAQSYDEAVSEARNEGREDGLNEGIDKQMADRRNQRNRKVDMPLGGGGTTTEKKQKGSSLAAQLMG